MLKSDQMEASIPDQAPFSCCACHSVTVTMPCRVRNFWRRVTPYPAHYSLTAAEDAFSRALEACGLSWRRMRLAASDPDGWLRRLPGENDRQSLMTGELERRTTYHNVLYGTSIYIRGKPRILLACIIAAQQGSRFARGV